MALISQNFKNDTQGNNLSVIPVVIVAELEDDKYNLLDSFSTSNLILQDQDDNSIETKEILQNISSVKNSIDYEQKNIKVNTFRFSLYNYYDAVTKLTNSVSFNDLNSLIGKYVILYYKTPTCSKINLNKNIQELSNDDCSIMFYGIVNRISQSGDKISIQAEDFTQDYIKDKQLPATKLADLDEKIKDGISDLDESKPVPMVYGKVDKAPSVVYQTNLDNNDGFKSLGMIHDSKEINGNFSTNKVATTVNYNHYLYLTEDDDYVVFPYDVEFDTLNSKSYFINPQTWTLEANDILPELEHTQSTPILCMGHTFPISALVDLSGENQLDSLLDVITDDNINENTDAMLDNWGYDKKWYRDDDAYTGSFDPNNVFNVESKTYIAGDDNHQGRWILLKLDKTKKLFRFDGYAKLFAGLDENGLPIQNTNTQRQVLKLKPLNTDLLKELIDNEIPVDDWVNNIMGDYIDGEQLEQTGISSVVRLETTENERITRVAEFKLHTENGFSHTLAKTSFDETKDVNKVLLFENFDSNSNQSLGFQLSNFSFMYLVEKTGYESDTFYASIEGRKDYTSTEDIRNLTQLQEEFNVTVGEAALGSDNTLPDFEALVNEWDTYFSSKYEVFPDEVTSNNNVNTFLNYWLYKHEGANESALDFAKKPNDTFPNLEYKTSSDVDDSSFLKSNQIVSSILHGLMEKLYINIIDNIVFNNEEVYQLALNTDPFTNEYTLNDGIYSHMLYYALTADTTYDKYEEVLEFREAFLPLLQEYSDYKKILLRRIFKYLYQSDLNEDSSDDLVSGYLYNWNDFNIDLDTNDGINDWIENLTPYLDDTISTINKSILDVESHFGQGIGTDVGNRLELYLWNENPNENGQKSPYLTMLWKHINYNSIKTECFTNPNVQFQTSGIVEKPTDIFINLLSRELNYGLGDNVLDTNFFDHNLIEESRAVYNGWKMGFCIDDNVEAKNLLQDISKETQSFFSFTPEGNFGLITIKNNYTEDDIDYVIDETDVLNYSISRTKRENVIIRNKCFYRYDNGLDKYTFNTDGFTSYVDENGESRSDILDVRNLLDYNGEQYYNINEDTAFSEKQLRYHTDTATAKKFQEFDLLNNCNQHLLMNLDLPLSYTIKCGDILHIPLLNDTKAFGIDYSKVEMLNGQPIYPLWIVTATDYSLDRIRVSAYQLHYLGTDGVHGFGENYDVVANLRMFNTTYPSIRNYNYLPLSERNQFVNYVQGDEIPYGDLNQDGVIDITDVIGLVNMIINNEYSDIADVNNSESLNVTDVIALVNTIIE